MGLASTQAAVFAGVASKSATRTGYRYAHDPYVLERFRLLREKLSKDEICSFAEQALNVKSIAFDEQFTPKQTRISAHALLARLMGHEAPAKIAATVNSGVLLLPVAESMEAWEAQALAAQAALKREVDADVNS